MPLLIEQSEPDVKLAFEVHRNANIVKIRLAAANMHAVTDGTSDEKIEVGLSFHAKQVPAPPDLLRLHVAFKMEGFPESPPRKRKAKVDPTALVECTYEVDYKMQQEFTLTPEHVRAFREGNAIFNLWPYFREFLQSHVTAMALPPFVAPLLRIQPKLPAPTQEPRVRKKTQPQ